MSQSVVQSRLLLLEFFKNHYGSRSKRGTEVAALFYTLCETAKLRNVEPRAYLALISAFLARRVPEVVGARVSRRSCLSMSRRRSMLYLGGGSRTNHRGQLG